MTQNTEVPFDTVEKIGRSVIHHGKYNDRIYLMKFHGEDAALFRERMSELVSKHGYSKIFAKVSEEHGDMFIKDGFEKEAFIPGFYNGSSGAVFLGKYLSPERKLQGADTSEVTRDVLETARKKCETSDRPLPEGHAISLLEEKDAQELAALYAVVFKTYPFPIFDPAYIIKTMRSDVMYFGVRFNGRIVAASSSEMDPASANVEMTDFATLPDFLGKGLAYSLLARMETAMKEKKIRTFYTIARALSHGMNVTFSRKGYQYAGQLINNTNIFGKLETMNVWYKSAPVL